MSLSVIICTYNVATFIEGCIKQIMPQLTADMELLIIDDGSTDETVALCRQYANEDNRIRLILLEHGGVSKARQAGLDAAKGKYILYIDADDKLAPTMIADMLAAATAVTADIVICDYTEITPHGNIYRKQQPSELSGTSLLNDILSGKLYGALWNKLLRHSWLLNAKATFLQQLQMREDLAFLSQCLPSARVIAYLPKALYGYNRCNANALTNSYLDESADYYHQEALWLTVVLANKYLTSTTRLHLKEYFSNLAYITMRRGCFTRNEWNNIFLQHAQWALYGKGYKRMLVKAALCGNYHLASLLRSAIAKINKSK